MTDPDGDLDRMTRDELLAAARAMRAAIREHRDSIGHDLCWHHPHLWALLPDSPAGGMIVPDWPQFMRGTPGEPARANETWRRVLREHTAPALDPGIDEAPKAFMAKRKEKDGVA